MNRIMVFAGIRSGIRSWAALGFAAIVLFSVTQRASAEPNYVAASGQNSSRIDWHTDLRSGWSDARRRNLPMVIFITSGRCHYCDAMRRDTWRNDSIRRRIAGRFVAIELTPERNARTLSKIHVPAYPMTLLGIPAGKVIAHRIGYQPPNAMLALLAEANSQPQQAPQR